MKTTEEKMNEIRSLVRGYYSTYKDGAEKVFEEALRMVVEKFESNRLIITARVAYVEEEDLFDKPIEETIAFLERYKGKGYRLAQQWSGYEDNYFAIEESRFENDEEYAKRLGKLTNECADMILAERKRNQLSDIDKQIAELQAKKSKLKNTI